MFIACQTFKKCLKNAFFYLKISITLKEVHRVYSSGGIFFATVIAKQQKPKSDRISTIGLQIVDILAIILTNISEDKL